MRKTELAGWAVIAVMGATAASAQSSGFTWEGSLELGVDSTFHSKVKADELTDTYAIFEGVFEAALADQITLFGGLTFESISDPGKTRQFDDMGLYISDLGLRLDLDPVTLSIGKFSPTYAFAWDDAPGFYGTALAEDYELSEVIGASLDMPIGAAGGELSLALFYFDNTVLSNSLGNKRGRNTSGAGGAGNTGKLNNVSLQWTQEMNDTTWWVGARRLSAGAGDVSDEKGVVAGLAHDFGDGIDVIAEIAHFNGFGGTGDDTTFGTFGSTYTVGSLSYSASFTGVRNSAAPNDRELALGVDYTFANGFELGGGVGLFKVGGVKSEAIGAALTIPFGG